MLFILGVLISVMRDSTLFKTYNVFIILDVTYTYLTHLSLGSLLWDIGKQNSPRCDAAERGVPSGAILFA